MTSIFGRDNDGPANSKAKAGPLPMPEANRPWTIGTSVNVAKYMKAPVKLAKKFDNNELPPTAHSIQLFGIMPAIAVSSCVEPNRKPAKTKSELVYLERSRAFVYGYEVGVRPELLLSPKVALFAEYRFEMLFNSILRNNIHIGLGCVIYL